MAFSDDLFFAPGHQLPAMLRARSLDLETHIFAPLQEAHDLEQIVGARIARRPQHSHEALGWNARRFGEVRKPRSR